MRPLAEFRPACYYGCLLTRPPETLQFDDCEQPSSMESLLRDLGAEPVEWNYKTECCGAGMTMADEDTVLELSHKILGNAASHGANCMVVACPMCHVNLDMKQPDVDRRYGCAARLGGLLSFRPGRAWPWASTSGRLGIDRHFVVERRGRTLIMARIGVFICWCGENIARNVDVRAARPPRSASCRAWSARAYKYMCSDPGQSLMRAEIAAERLTGVVIASCSPHMHLRTFRKAAAAGRAQSLPGRDGQHPRALLVGTPRPRAGHGQGRRADRACRWPRCGTTMPWQPIAIPVTRRALVIGGGVAGIQAALDIADAGYQVVLVEREPSIGGKMAGLSETFPTLDCSQCILTPRMVDVGQHPNITLHTYSEVESVEGYVGNFKVTIRKKARYVDVDEVHRLRPVLERLPLEKEPQRVRLRHGQPHGHLRALPAGRARPAGDRRMPACT